MKFDSKSLLLIVLTALGLFALVMVLILAEKLLTIWQHLQEAPVWLTVLYVVVILAVALLPVWLFLRLTRPKSAPQTQVKVIDESSLQQAIDEERLRGVDTTGAHAEMSELHRRRASGRFHISLFGGASTGKSSLIRALMPEQPLAVLFRDPGDDWAATCDRVAAAAMHVRFDYLSSGLISAVRRRSMDIRTYTANDPEAVAPFRERGLTGVITDHPPFYLDREDWRNWNAA